MRKDIVETKKWLLRGWKIEQNINSLLALREETLERIMSTTTNTNSLRVSGTGENHKVDRLVELDGEIDAEIDKLVDIKREIVEAVMKLPDNRHRTLLIDRYTRFRRWEQIAVDMNYTYRQTQRLHVSALMALKDVIECHIGCVL